MFDLSRNAQGALGLHVFFSDLYGACLADGSELSLGLKTRSLDVFVDFAGGAPVAAGGIGLENDRLGEVLVQKGLVDGPSIDAALERQIESSLPLGRLLTDRVDRDGIDTAMRTQIMRRTSRLFGLKSGDFRIERSLVRPAALRVTVEGHGLLLASLRVNASSEELRDLTDRLLGKAIQSCVGPAELEKMKPNEVEAKVFELIEKPRKPDQIERALKDRRPVQVALKAALAAGYAIVVPQKQAVPIRDAIRVVPPAAGLPVSPIETSSEPTPTEPLPAAAPAPRRAPSVPPPPVAKAPAPELPKLSRELEAKQKDLRQLHDKLAELDYYALFGLEPKASTSDIRKRYGELAKKYHPDSFAQAGEEDRAMASAVTARLNEAYATLASEEKRASYAALLSQGVKEVKDTEGAKKAAELRHEMGLVMLKRRDFRSAREHFKVAMKNDPLNLLYSAYYAWALFSDPTMPRKQTIEDALGLLEPAAKQLEEKNADVLFFHGKVLQETGDTKGAIRQFKAAIKLDPEHREAERELRLASMRKSAGKDDGLADKLKGLFKKS